MQPTPPRGKLKVFLGYAAGVGKTYQMLSEAQDLHRKGHDVVIGYFEPHGRQDTIARTEGLEIVPRRRVEYRGTAFEEMDTAAILARRPAVCVVDEFPHTNVPGSERSKRWQDVDVLLDAGIDVLTTMNIQHLESLNDHVWQISGVRVRETIPDWVVQQADQVVMVDLAPEALLNRLLRGVVYAPDKAKRAMENFFQESTLVALRELALRQAGLVPALLVDGRLLLELHVDADVAELRVDELEELVGVVARPLVEQIGQELEEVAVVEAPLDLLDLLLGERLEDVLPERLDVALFDRVLRGEADLLNRALVEVDLHR